MSYADFGSGRSSGFDVLSSAGDADAEYVRLTQGVTDALGEMLANVSRMSGLVSKLGGPKDSPRLRDTLGELSENTRLLARRTGREIKIIGTLDGGSRGEMRARKLQQNKLTRDFQAAMASFKEVEEARATKEKAFVRKARASMSGTHPGVGAYGGPAGASDSQSLLGNGGGGGGGMGNSQAQLELDSLENEIAFNDDIIAERETEIKEIESTIAEVGEIFRDLAEIVNEQGDMLNEIDNNIESTVSHTDGAATQLRIANDYHKSATRKKFICAFIIFLICAVVIVALSIGLGGRKK